MRQRAEGGVADEGGRVAQREIQVARSGGVGVLAEYPVERLLREAMILPIWEGTPHRQILDGMEVMERKQAHRLLFDYLVERGADLFCLTDLQAEVEGWLARPAEVREAESEGVFRHLAEHTARALTR